MSKRKSGKRQTAKQDPGVVAYYRVSTKKQGDSGLGLESQQAIVRHYYGESAAEFTEVESGKSTSNRPELRKAIKLCHDKGYTLVVAKVDRLSRNTEDTLRIYRRLDGRFRSCDLPMVNGDESAFKFALTLQAAMAERERELISIRTKTALAATKARGTKLGTPENLTDQAREHSAEVRTAAAKDAYRQVYGYIAMMRDQGMSYDHIAKRLNEEGHTTRQGKPFQAMTVYRILKRGNGG